jgi:hypothetical protein
MAKEPGQGSESAGCQSLIEVPALRPPPESEELSQKIEPSDIGWIPKTTQRAASIYSVSLLMVGIRAKPKETPDGSEPASSAETTLQGGHDQQPDLLIACVDTRGAHHMHSGTTGWGILSRSIVRLRPCTLGHLDRSLLNSTMGNRFVIAPSALWVIGIDLCPNTTGKLVERSWIGSAAGENSSNTNGTASVIGITVSGRLIRTCSVAMARAEAKQPD